MAAASVSSARTPHRRVEYRFCHVVICRASSELLRRVSFEVVFSSSQHFASISPSLAPQVSADCWPNQLRGRRAHHGNSSGHQRQQQHSDHARALQTMNPKANNSRTLDSAPDSAPVSQSGDSALTPIRICCICWKCRCDISCWSNEMTVECPACKRPVDTQQLRVSRCDVCKCKLCIQPSASLVQCPKCHSTMNPRISPYIDQEHEREAAKQRKRKRRKSNKESQPLDSISGLDSGNDSLIAKVRKLRPVRSAFHYFVRQYRTQAQNYINSLQPLCDEANQAELSTSREQQQNSTAAAEDSNSNSPARPESVKQVLGVKWSQLNDDHQRPYVDACKADQARYAREFQELLLNSLQQSARINTVAAQFAQVKLISTFSAENLANCATASIQADKSVNAFAHNGADSALPVPSLALPSQFNSNSLPAASSSSLVGPIGSAAVVPASASASACASAPASASASAAALDGSSDSFAASAVAASAQIDSLYNQFQQQLRT